MSFRLNSQRLERLRRVARALNRTPGEVAAQLVEEGLRLREFPGVEFRDTPVGRQAFLRGTRLGIWQIAAIAAEYAGAIGPTAEHLGITSGDVGLAMAYARAHPAEIEAAIADIRAANERLAAGSQTDGPETGQYAGARA